MPVTQIGNHQAVILLIRSVLIGGSLAAISMGGHAQTPPSAGTILQEIERERQQSLPQRVAPEKPAAPPAMQPTGITVEVKQFRFAGNLLLSSEQLAAVLAEYLNRPLDFAQLQAAARAVAAAYREAGWIVRAYLPKQDIQNGVVTIQIVEAVFGKLHSQGDISRLPAATVRARFDAQQKGGEPLNSERLDRALLLADDLPGVAVAGTLRPGSNERETDLAIKLADEPLIVGEAAIDNTGSRSTGSERITANLSLNSPFGYGDQITGNLIHARGTDYLRLAYSAPIGAEGWRLGANVSRLDYKIVEGSFAGLLRGDSSAAGVDASYPIIRSRLKNLFFHLGYDRKQFDNRSATPSRYRIDGTSLGLFGNLFDTVGGGGANSASLNWMGGQRDNAVGTTDDSFSKLRYSLSRQQVITPDVSIFAAVSGQESGDALDSSEQFYLGGANGVRAYPASEAGGDSGVLTNLELRWKLPEGFTVTGFHDYGHVRNNDAAMSYSLKGYGLSLGWQASFGLHLKASWARRIGSNPNPTFTGQDQDGSLDKHRWWFSASLPF